MKQGIKMVRGTSCKLSLTVVDANSSVYTLKSGEAIIFGVKAKLDDADYIVLKKVTSGTSGVYEIEIDPEDTASVEPGTYFYDVGLLSGEDYYNIIPVNSFILQPNVTTWEASK